MDSAIFSSIIAAASAVAGGGLVSITQLLSAKAAHLAQFRLEEVKSRAATTEKRSATIVNSYTEVHKILSRINREFSLTSLDIMWRAELSGSDYDQKYLASCESLDDARALIDLYFPEISEEVEKIYGQMNMFWGNFKEIRSLTETKEPHTKKQIFQNEAVAASMKIAEYTKTVKGKLKSLAGP